MTLSSPVRDRFWCAIRHQQPDRVPYHIGYTVAARAVLEQHFGTTDLDAAIGNELAVYKARLTYEPVSPGFARDEWGILWNKTTDPDIGVVDHYLLDKRSLSPLRVPDPLDPRRFAGLDAWTASNRQRFRVLSVSFALFERAWTLRGMTELMVDMVEAPEFVDELLDVILDWDKAVLRALLPYDFDAVRFGDDWGTQRGLLLGRRRWQRFIKPRVAQLYAMARAAGKAVMIHSCGKVQELFPELVEIGVEVFNPFQPDVMDVYAAKREFGDRLAFWGGLSVQNMLPYGTPEQVRSETRRLMAEIGRGGGFIVAPSHELTGDIPLANMLALIETVQSQ